jgi:hypothetical protein
VYFNLRRSSTGTISTGHVQNSAFVVSTRSVFNLFGLRVTLSSTSVVSLHCVLSGHALLSLALVVLNVQSTLLVLGSLLVYSDL